MGFTQGTIDFLFENRLHDSREWFGEHKQDYKALVTEPLGELVTELAPIMAKIDKMIICDPKRISRIYRDARYAKDSVFRDEVWYTFARERPNAWAGHPGYYFSVGAGGISYGCGYYCADGSVKEALRRMIMEDNPVYTAAYEALRGQRTFKMYGELYKKNHFPEQPAEKCEWLNRKEYGVSFFTNDPAVMFSDKLIQKVGRDFRKVAPFYDFCMRAHELAEQT